MRRPPRHRLLSALYWAGAAASLWLALAAPAAAQPDHGDVRGTVADSSGAPLPGAHVLLMGARDVLVGFGTAGPDGAFQIGRVPTGAYTLRATFIGYAARDVPVSVVEGGTTVGEIRLEEEVGELGQLVVSGDRPPVVLRGDTLVYSAADYAVRPGGKVEDLLRRLPGVEVDADGTVRANGEVVRDVLVDGKEFFGGTPTVATQNLPADAVERVEVFEKRSRMAEFTGVDDGAGRTALNLALKEDRKSGLFGSAASGAGGATPYDGRLRYAGRALVNRFGETTRLSVLGRANNVNRAALSVREYLTLIPRPQSDGSTTTAIKLSDALPMQEQGWEGFSTTSLLGANGLYDPARGPDVQAHYLGYRVRTDRDGRAVRDRLGAGTSFRETEEADRAQTLNAHRLSVHADQTLGPGHDVAARVGLDWTASAGRSRTLLERSDPDGAPVSEAAATSTEDATGLDGDALLTYRRRLGAGRTVVAEVGGAYDGHEARDELASDTRSLVTDLPGATAVRESYQRESADRSGWVDVRATQALGGQRTLQVEVEARHRRQHLSQHAVGLGASPVPLGDGDVEVAHSRQRFGLGYRDQWADLRLSVGLSAERLASASPVSSPVPDRRDAYLLPSLSLTYSFGQNRRLEAQYRAAMQEPEAEELQPFTNTRGAFEVFGGNPALRPEFAHDLDLRYVHFDAFTLRSVLALARVTYTQDAISSSRTVGTDLRQRVTPINVDREWAAYGTGSFGTPVAPLRGSVKLSATLHYRSTVEQLGGLESGVRVLGGSLGVDYQNRTPEPVDVRLGVRLESSGASYSLRPEAGRTVSLLTPRAEVGWYAGRALELRTSVEHRVRVAGSQPERSLKPLWSAETAWAVDPRTRLRLSVTDLLSRGRSISYDETAAYVEQRVTQTLGRYVLLSLERDF